MTFFLLTYFTIIKDILTVTCNGHCIYKKTCQNILSTDNSDPVTKYTFICVREDFSGTFLSAFN